MHDKCRAAALLTVVDDAASQLFCTCTLQQPVQRAAVVGTLQQGQLGAMSGLCNARKIRVCKISITQHQELASLQPDFGDSRAPSGTHRVAINLLHQLRQAIVFSFSSQFQEVFPVSAICGVG